MKKGSSVEITTTNSIFKIVKGQKYTIIKLYWYNGEGWAKVKDVDGIIIEIPDIFIK